MLTRRMNTMLCGSPMSQEFNRLMETFLHEGDGSAGTRAFPPMNVWEDEQNVIVEAELPGFDMKDLDIGLVGDTLTIGGKRTVEAATEGMTFYRRERSSGEFSRTLRFKTPIDAARVGAVLENGVLKITLPKGEAARARKIEVKTA